MAHYGAPKIHSKNNAVDEITLKLIFQKIIFVTYLAILGGGFGGPGYSKIRAETKNIIFTHEKIINIK